MKGKMITLYGVNNMGKSTHALLLVERLKEAGYDAVYVKYPVYEIVPSGPFLNEVLRGGAQKISEEQLQLWFVVNRHQFQGELLQWLTEGKIVVAEDYVGTGMAWGITKGLDEEWLRKCNEHLLKEDLAILLEGERFKGAIEKGHVHEENDDLIVRCYENFRYLAKKYYWQRVRVQNKMEDTADLIWEVVSKQLT